MKVVIYFLNLAFSKSLNDRIESEIRDLANMHDEHFEVHGQLQNGMPRNIEHMMSKRSLLNKRFEPTGWLSSMMTGAISKFGHCLRKISGQLSFGYPWSSGADMFHIICINILESYRKMVHDHYTEFVKILNDEEGFPNNGFIKRKRPIERFIGHRYH